jgi:hypothetical protein
MIVLDVVWPGMLVLTGLYSVWVILAGLLIDFLVLLVALHIAAKHALLIDVAMNLATALLGLILLPLATLIVVIPFPQTFSAGSWIATFTAITLVDSAVEFAVISLARKFLNLGLQLGWKSFAYVVAATTLSIALAFWRIVHSTTLTAYSWAPTALLLVFAVFGALVAFALAYEGILTLTQ